MAGDCKGGDFQHPGAAAYWKRRALAAEERADAADKRLADAVAELAAIRTVRDTWNLPLPEPPPDTFVDEEGVVALYPPPPVSGIDVVFGEEPVSSVSFDTIPSPPPECETCGGKGWVIRRSRVVSLPGMLRPGGAVRCECGRIPMGPPDDPDSFARDAHAGALGLLGRPTTSACACVEWPCPCACHGSAPFAAKDAP